MLFFLSAPPTVLSESLYRRFSGCSESMSTGRDSDQSPLNPNQPPFPTSVRWSGAVSTAGVVYDYESKEYLIVR